MPTNPIATTRSLPEIPLSETRVIRVNHFNDTDLCSVWQR